VRSTAVFWIGQSGGETEFLAGLVRNDQERADLRRTAAHAIGVSRDQSALATLLSLYNTVAPKEVKRGIIHAISDNENKEEAYAFLLKVAKTDPDREARRTAVHLIGESGRESAVDDLMRIYAQERESDVKRARRARQPPRRGQAP
jgi:HEAT repeat protein